MAETSQAMQFSGDSLSSACTSGAVLPRLTSLCAGPRMTLALDAEAWVRFWVEAALQSLSCDSLQAQLWAWGASSGVGLPCGSLNHQLTGEHLLHDVPPSALPRLHATNGTESSPITGHIAGHFWVWQPNCCRVALLTAAMVQLCSGVRRCWQLAQGSVWIMKSVWFVIWDQKRETVCGWGPFLLFQLIRNAKSVDSASSAKGELLDLTSSLPFFFPRTLGTQYANCVRWGCFGIIFSFSRIYLR